MKYSGIVLFSDFDGTLLDDTRQLSKENVDAINYFVNNGGLFGVATGRINSTVPLRFPELPINTPSIFFNGALVYDLQNQREIDSVFLPQELAPIFQDVMNRYPDSSIEINTHGKAFVPRYNDIIRIQVAREGLSSVEAKWEDIPGDWYKVLIADQHETLVKIKKEIEDLNREDFKIMFSENEFLDVVAPDVSKGKALLQQKRANGDKWKLVIAVGDNDNDVEMIREADVGIAVANAQPSVKMVAKHKIAHHNIPCIPQVLKIINSYL